MILMLKIEMIVVFIHFQPDDARQCIYRPISKGTNCVTAVIAMTSVYIYLAFGVDEQLIFLTLQTLTMH